MSFKPNNWTLMTPHARMAFTGGSEQFVDTLKAIPGVKLKKGIWHVPFHAIDVVLHFTEQLGAKATFVEWVEKPPETPDSWKVIQDKLLDEGMRPEYVIDWARPHQVEGVMKGWNRSGLHLWWTTGSGKTWAGAALCLSEPGNVLIVTRSAAKIQLGREFERFIQTRSFVIRADSSIRTRTLVGGKTWQEFFKERMPELGKAELVSAEWQSLKEEKGEVVETVSQTLKEYVTERRTKGERPIVVIGWESLIDHLDKLEWYNPKVVVFDELHMGKGRKRFDSIQLPPLPSDPVKARAQLEAEHKEAKDKDGFIKESETAPGMPPNRIMLVPVMNRAAAAALIARNARKRIGLTATPIADRVRDLWAQLDSIDPNSWGNKTQFLRRHCDLKPGKYGGMDDSGESNLEELQMRLGMVAHKVPAHVAHRHLLGLKRRQSLYIAPEDQTRALAGYGKELRQAKRMGANALLECRIAQACSKKRRAIIGMVGQHVSSGHKIVIFTGRRRDCADIEGALRREKLIKNRKAQIWAADGDMDVELRQDIVDEYMEHPGPCILVGTMQAFGQSINLHDTDAAFMVMLPYTPEMLRQAEGRFVRLGMKRPVVIYYAIAEDTVDEHVASILINKLPAVEKIADDKELAAAEDVLAGLDTGETEEEFAAAVLDLLD